MAWDLALVPLRDILADLYLDQESAKQVGRDAGLDLKLISFSDRAITNWTNILRYASGNEQVEAVIGVARVQNPGHKRLAAAAQHWLASWKHPNTYRALVDASNLPIELYERCYSALLKCREFDGDEPLRDIFDTPELRPFRSELPPAGDLGGRVQGTLGYLSGECLSSGRPVLSVFLQTLAERLPPASRLGVELHSLVGPVEATLAEETEPLAAIPRAGGFGGRQATSRFLTGEGWAQSTTQRAIQGILFPEEERLSDPTYRRAEQLEFLDCMTSRIRREMRKAGAEHFVELSMKLADPDEAQSIEAQEGPGLALATDDARAGPRSTANPVDLDSTLSRYGELVLLGDPGSGKTTVLHHLTLRLIGAFRAGQSSLLPLFVPLTRYAEQPKGRGTEPLLEFLHAYVCDLVGREHFIATHFDGLVRMGRFLIILDGLDQMPERRSETARLERLRQVEAYLRRIEVLRKIVRLLGLRRIDSWLVRGQDRASRQVAPVIDPRERAIEALPEVGSPVVASCRRDDYFGVPDWQVVRVLPMDETQIAMFVDLYAPESEPVVRQQWESAGATRSLISNPFYLRMLMRAVKEHLQPDGTLPDTIHQALPARGSLLTALIEQGIAREVKESPEVTKRIMRHLGRLAFYMLEHNIIDAVVPQDAVQRTLGDESARILLVAEDVGLMQVRQGPPLSIEFTHQLFLETLLAFHLVQQSRDAKEFERGLALLGRQGDRWAEALKLLFEMVEEDERRQLVDQFLKALHNPSTWDVATRLLSDVGRGYGVGPPVQQLLRDGKDLTRRGAATILGRIHAVEYTTNLIDLRDDGAWQVRRAAVEALVNMGQLEALEAYAEDPRPVVVRAVLRGYLLLGSDPAALIENGLAGENGYSLAAHMAWAVHDSMADLLHRTSQAEMLGILERMMEHEDDEVRVVGYLACRQAPDHIVRRLKGELLKGALEESDPTINLIAGGTVAPLLTPNDLQRIREQAGGRRGSGDEGGQPAARRAYWLLVEAQGQYGTQAYVGGLASAQPAEIQVIAQRLAERADSKAIAGIIHLLGHATAPRTTVEALLGLGSLGSQYLLAALDDPVPRVRREAAEVLQFCHLPRRYARQVRVALRRSRSQGDRGQPDDRDLKAPGTSWHMDPDVQRAMSWVGPLASVMFAPVYWLLGKILGLDLPFSYWMGYDVFQSAHSIAAVYSPPYSPWQLSQIEQDAFSLPLLQPSVDFWLIRGRLLHAEGRLTEAAQTLDRGLATDATSASLRYELALVRRAQGDLDGAQALLEADEGRFVRTSTQMRGLHELLELDRQSQESSDPGVREQHARLLTHLGLWEEARGSILQLYAAQESRSEDYFFLLYLCYGRIGHTRQALAAALENNEQVADQPQVPQAEIDRLRWLHRQERVPAQVSGRIAMLLDLKQEEAALALLREAQLLPPEGEELAREHVDLLFELRPELRQAIMDLLERRGNETDFLAVKEALEL